MSIPNIQCNNTFLYVPFHALARILVIEDDPDGQEVLCEFLRLHDFELVGRGSNGLDALELYKKLKPDVVLMDFFMPEYDGIFGISKIKEYDNLAKVIILSASATPPERQKMRDLGAVDVLTKPYDLDFLVTLINKISNKKNLETKQIT